MFTQQRESRHAVIELGLGPGLFIVAGFAFIAFLALVLVVFFMACNALGLHLVLVDIPLVATAACNFFMLAEQGIPG